jgi:anhydro-N-acetylmuramic acid kinase
LAPAVDRWKELCERLGSGRAVVAGVLSGTSADGIDVVLAAFPARDGAPGERDVGRPDALAFDTRPFPAEVAGRVRALLDGAPIDLAGVACLARDLGRAFGRAARELADERGLALDLVGSHGQTVFHHDGRADLGRATLQLGDAAFAAEEARAPVVHDFRAADLAAGGEGAPLSALCDELLYGELSRPALIVNLGGMANVTYLAERADERSGLAAAGLLSFDTGPAGSLLDGLARRLLGRTFDPDGATAARGRPDAGLLAELLAHPFLARTPPKSTGRDTFGEPWVDEVLGRARARGLIAAGPADLFATATEFVARSVAEARRFFPSPPRSFVACGGGVRNRTLALALERALGVPAVPSERFGVDPDAREALVFAILAARAVLGIPSTHPQATGARVGRILGSLTPGPLVAPSDSEKVGPAA